MGNDKKPIITQVYQMRNDALNDEGFQHFVAQQKSILENLPGNVQLVLARPKSATSLARKYHKEPQKYSDDVRQAKDFLGFMAVVTTPQDGQTLIDALMERYSQDINPLSPNAIVNTSFDPFPAKGYRTEDGYKNFRVHMVRRGYPMEIQVKTREQFIAHYATHDPIYKSPHLEPESSRPEDIEKAEKLKREISDKMYPYFEASAYLHFHRDSLSPEEQRSVKQDIKEIYTRNKHLFARHPRVFNDACITYATYCFIYDNHRELFSDATFRDSVLQSTLLETNVQRVFRFIYKQNNLDNFNMHYTDVLQKTVKDVAEMPYQDYVRMEKMTRGSFRQGICVYSGIFDRLREKDIITIDALKNNFREVHLGVFSDEFAEQVSGMPTVFNQDFRRFRAEQLKNVSGTSIVDTDGKITYETSIAPIPFAEQEEVEHEYDVFYISGVCDLCHAGHIKHATKPDAAKIYFGVKTDNYVRTRKGKEPLTPENDRLATMSHIRGIEDAFLTDNDILPPQQVLDEMSRSFAEGGRVGIGLGSDWTNHPEKKGPESRAEMAFLKENYPFIELVPCLDRSKEDESKLSSSSLREVAIAREQAGVINNSTVTVFGGQ